MRRFKLRRCKEKECVIMNQQNSNERSKYNEHLPRYYKGYDVDAILEKMCRHYLPKDERIAINEVIRDYYDKYFKNEAEGPLKINGISIYPPGTMINNPFLNFKNSLNSSKTNYIGENTDET